MAEIHFENVDDILSCFSELADLRSHVNRRHVFGDLIVICIMAVIAGADGPKVIPELLDNIEIKDAVVTIDAAGCQCAIAKQTVPPG